ncbi:hypothetical protein [Mucilaginibacter sp. SP1R1]|uniref:hypothetical protein n=1 Tax=Mucilaginibacter sp. SP1R1 TaxID=2723091 RepID=UPI00161D18F8|nr:hypothetical protein [Mucilaginibacter sp. SP1R1]MBB6151493.1 hypothetical protein [Mucilaginibacter sp. SP1R1]
MKRAAVLSIAAFYLLLTTGMFVCMVHCTGESYFRPKMVMNMQAMHHEAQQSKKHKTCGKDCDCCKKHGDYVIKENIKPTLVDFQGPKVAVILRQFHYIPVTAQYYAGLNTPILQYGKAPPGISGKAISIQFRSLQI